MSRQILRVTSLLAVVPMASEQNIFQLYNLKKNINCEIDTLTSPVRSTTLYRKIHIIYHHRRSAISTECKQNTER